MEAKYPKISSVFVRVKIYQLKNDLKIIQTAEAMAEPIKIDFVRILIVGMKANPRLKIMNRIRKGVKCRSSFCKKDTSKNLLTIGSEVVERSNKIKSEPKITIPRNLIKLKITPLFRLA